MTKSNWINHTLLKADEIYSNINKNSLIAIFIALPLLIICVLLSKADFYGSHITHLSLAINFLLLISILLLATISFYTTNIQHIENMSQEYVLKIINKISRVKFSIFNLDDLMKLICLKLREDLKGKFWLVLNEGGVSEEVDEFYKASAQHVLENMIPIVLRYNKKIIFFEPLFLQDKKVGVLISEVENEKKYTPTLRKILPDQLAIIISNFETRLQLNHSEVKQEREKLRSLILSSISHDLKTPLSSIIGSLNIFNELSQKNKLDEESEKTLILTAIEEAERLKGFISEVLEMTKIESGAIKLQKQFLSPQVVVEKTCKRFESHLKNHRLEIKLNNEVRVNFDPTSCEQIIQNLVDNAVKYSPKNTMISIRDEFRDNVYFIFIQDESGGINPKKLNLIFNKFERFALKDKVVGSGLGLSIVKALMELNNASIMAKNDENNKGAVFVLEFKDFVRNDEKISIN